MPSLFASLKLFSVNLSNQLVLHLDLLPPLKVLLILCINLHLLLLVFFLLLLQVLSYQFVNLGGDVGITARE